MPAPLTRLLEALPEGVAQAALPTPFPVGPVNCYLLAERPITVVDPGMFFPESLQVLDDLLSSAHVRASDVDVIVVTHGHPDHFGAAGWLAERSGAPIVTGRAEARKVCMARERLDGYRAVLEVLGVPESAVALFPSFMERVADLVAPVDTAMIAPIDDGNVVEAGGRRFAAHVTPGHAAGHLSLFDGETLLSGDHLLPRISPNPFLELAEGDMPDRRRSLLEYLASLDRFVTLDPSSVLPGHGEAFSDVALWTRRVRQHHERRASDVLDLLARHSGSTAWELAQLMFPNLDGFSIMLGVSEAVGHLDLLANDGRAVSDNGKPERWFAA